VENVVKEYTEWHPVENALRLHMEEEQPVENVDTIKESLVPVLVLVFVQDLLEYSVQAFERNSSSFRKRTYRKQQCPRRGHKTKGVLVLLVLLEKELTENNNAPRRGHKTKGFPVLSVLLEKELIENNNAPEGGIKQKGF
jgi:hypothetical protein